MTAFPLRLAIVPAIAAAVLATACPAVAQGGGFLDNIFGGSDRFSTSPSQPPTAQPQQTQAQPGQPRQDPGELTARIHRLEAEIRRLTGVVEQLEHRNHQLEAQLRGVQGVPPAQATPPRPQTSATTAPPPAQAVPPRPQTSATTAPPPAQPPATSPSGRRGDAFDPTLSPNAPGAPKVLGTLPSNSAKQMTPEFDPDDSVGAAGGAGAPLDLSTMAGGGGAGAQPKPPVEQPSAQPPRAPGGQVATLPPSDSPRDHFDLASGYIQRKDFAQAEAGFRNFLSRFPNDRLVADAQFWLGESLYQRQSWRDAAETFLNVSTKYETHARAPDALLRLGQALAQMGEREAACASLAEVQRKYPRASVGVRQSVEREQKRVRC